MVDHLPSTCTSPDSSPSTTKKGSKEALKQVTLPAITPPPHSVRPCPVREVLIHPLCSITVGKEASAEVRNTVLCEQRGNAYSTSLTS